MKKTPASEMSVVARRHKHAALKHLRLIDEAGERLERVRSSLVLLLAAANSGDPAMLDLSPGDVQSAIGEAARGVLSEVVALRDVHEGLHDAMQSVRGAR
jgi:hypothetical protein